MKRAKKSIAWSYVRSTFEARLDQRFPKSSNPFLDQATYLDLRFILVISRLCLHDLRELQGLLPNLLLGETDALPESRPVILPQLIGHILSPDFHRHPGRKFRVANSADEIVEGRQFDDAPSLHLPIQQGEIFAMGIVVADEIVEDDCIGQVNQITARCTGSPSNQTETIRQPRTTFILIFNPRGDPQSLIEVLLV